jgi:hypothetical protein
MTDDFIRRLQSEWRAQPIDRSVMIGRLRRGRWTPRLLLWLEVLQGVVGVAFGAAFLWLALDPDRLSLLLVSAFDRQAVSKEDIAYLARMLRWMLGAGGLVMLAAVPPLAWAAVRARLDGLKWEDETPESVLRFGLRRVDASLRANRLGRWHVWVLLAFVAGLWGLALVGLAPVFFLAQMTILYLLAIAGVWIWLDLRRERLRREMEACLRLLQELGADGGEAA